MDATGGTAPPPPVGRKKRSGSVQYPAHYSPPNAPSSASVVPYCRKVSNPSQSDNNVPWLLTTLGGRSTLVAMVGLPARGKTLISGRLCRFLTWNKIDCKVFNISDYMREFHTLPLGLENPMFEVDEEAPDESPFGDTCQDNPPHIPESFVFDHSIHRCLNDIKHFFSLEKGEIAILDSDNTTRAKRQDLIDFCGSNGYDLFFIETMTEDTSIVQMFLTRFEVKHPDYPDLTHEQVVRTIIQMTHDQKATYQPLCQKNDSELSFMQITDAGQNIQVHNMQGFLQSKIVYYLMNIHFARRMIYMTRHGESVFNLQGKVGGDSGLSARGLQYASSMCSYFNALKIPGLQVWTSSLARTIQTAQMIKNATLLCWNALNEIDVGLFDGFTYEEIKEKFPKEYVARDNDKFNYRYPGGESYDDLITRLEPVIMEIERTHSLLIVCHQAVVRCLLAYFTDKSFEELPYMEVPLHTLFCLRPGAKSCAVHHIPFNIEAVSTQRSSTALKRISSLPHIACDSHKF